MRVFFIVHGFVQGVGYRYLVKTIADKHKVRGMVRNAPSGAVDIYAEADEIEMAKFEGEIRAESPHGPSVLYIQKFREGESGFPSHAKSYNGFVIER